MSYLTNFFSNPQKTTQAMASQSIENINPESGELPSNLKYCHNLYKKNTAIGQRIRNCQFFFNSFIYFFSGSGNLYRRIHAQILNIVYSMATGPATKLLPKTPPTQVISNNAIITLTRVLFFINLNGPTEPYYYPPNNENHTFNSRLALGEGLSRGYATCLKLAQFCDKLCLQFNNYFNHRVIGGAQVVSTVIWSFYYKLAWGYE